MLFTDTEVSTRIRWLEELEMASSGNRTQGKKERRAQCAPSCKFYSHVSDLLQPCPYIILKKKIKGP